MTPTPGRYVTYPTRAFFFAREERPTVNYSNVKYCDVANGPGVRTVLFVSGCRVCCPGCFNAEAQPFDAGEPFDEAAAEAVWKSLEPPWVDGLTILGGEPFEPENQAALRPFLEETRRRFPDKGVWCFSGYIYDVDLLPEDGRRHTGDTDAMLACVDVLVDGPYVAAEHDVTLRFRGSANQRIIDLAAMRAAGDPSTLVAWADEAVYATRGSM